MTFEDVINSSEKGFVQTPAAVKQAWKKVSDELKFHYTGEIPDSLAAAFPNEEAHIRLYRVNNYAAITKALLSKAIKSMYRFFSKSQYSIDFENSEMKNFFNTKRFGDNSLSLDSYVFREVYPLRVIDPNAVILPKISGPGLESNNVRLNIDLQVIESRFIESKSSSLLIYRNETSEEVAVNGAVYNVSRWIYTLNDISFDATDSKGDKKIVLLYSHNLNYAIWETLGGRHTVISNNTLRKSYFESDFSPAVPFLSRAVTFESMFFGVASTQGYPIKVAMTRTCDECDGEKTILQSDNTECTCPKCHGKGEIPLGNSPSEIITLTVKGNTAEEQAKYAQIRPAYFISPETNSINTLRDLSNEAYERAKDILNIDKSILLAQSGVAKEIDKQDSSIEIYEIAEQVFQIVENLLKSIQSLVFLDNSKITVNQPVDFIQKSEADLFLAFSDTLKNNSPYDIRLKSFSAYLQRRYNNDKVGLTLALLVAEYAPLYLYSIEERNNMMQIADFEKVKAIFAYSEILSLYNDDNLIIENKELLFDKLDESIKAKMPSVIDLSI